MTLLLSSNEGEKSAGIVKLTVGNLHTVMLAYLLNFVALGLDPTITGRPRSSGDWVGFSGDCVGVGE